MHRRQTASLTACMCVCYVKSRATVRLYVRAHAYIKTASSSANTAMWYCHYSYFTRYLWLYLVFCFVSRKVSLRYICRCARYRPQSPSPAHHVRGGPIRVRGRGQRCAGSRPGPGQGVCSRCIVCACFWTMATILYSFVWPL